jgi:hypothetical protein
MRAKLFSQRTAVDWGFALLAKKAQSRTLAEALTDNRSILDIKGQPSVPALAQFCYLREQVNRITLNPHIQDQSSGGNFRLTVCGHQARLTALCSMASSPS